MFTELISGAGVNVSGAVVNGLGTKDSMHAKSLIGLLLTFLLAELRSALTRKYPSKISPNFALRDFAFSVRAYAHFVFFIVLPQETSYN